VLGCAHSAFTHAVRKEKGFRAYTRNKPGKNHYIIYDASGYTGKKTPFKPIS
jgi:hypothetical protein